ncbi:MAG TPA: hypothetical protein VKV03_06490, partial [Candidatus Binataceae bacterium]|nr:hypothetical protein [Candidatus Binataceae bacterium]
PAEWPALKLMRHPATEILALQWNVATILGAIDRGEAPSPPARKQLSMIIWRSRNRVSYREIDGAERDELEAIAAACTFAEICEMIASAAGEENPAAAINQCLEAWLRDGILVRG